MDLVSSDLGNFCTLRSAKLCVGPCEESFGSTQRPDAFVREHESDFFAVVVAKKGMEMIHSVSVRREGSATDGIKAVEASVILNYRFIYISFWKFIDYGEGERREIRGPEFTRKVL